MKILIMSDTHGLTKEINEIKNRKKTQQPKKHKQCRHTHQPTDAILKKNIEVVKGNCDCDSNYLDEKIIELTPGISCYVTHGHLYDVKRSLEKLSYRAEELVVNFCFFGHTHIAGVTKINNVIYINPGSIKYPKGSDEKTYALLELTEQTYQLTFYNDKGLIVDKN